jgi:hypothetical protein
VGAAHHRPEPDQKLQDGNPHAGLGGAFLSPRHDQRVEGLLGLGGTSLCQGEPDVRGVGGDEGDPCGQPKPVWSVESQSQGKGEENQEEDEIPIQRRDVGTQGDPLRPAVPVDVGREADQAHGERCEQEGRPDDCPDRDVFALRSLEQGDDRDQGLGHRRPDCGEQASDRALAQLEAIADPLRRVREQKRPGQDHREACDQQDEIHRGRSYA